MAQCGTAGRSMAQRVAAWRSVAQHGSPWTPRSPRPRGRPHSSPPPRCHLARTRRAAAWPARPAAGAGGTPGSGTPLVRWWHAGPRPCSVRHLAAAAHARILPAPPLQTMCLCASPGPTAIGLLLRVLKIWTQPTSPPTPHLTPTHPPTPLHPPHPLQLGKQPPVAAGQQHEDQQADHQETAARGGVRWGCGGVRVELLTAAEIGRQAGAEGSLSAARELQAALHVLAAAGDAHLTAVRQKSAGWACKHAAPPAQEG